MFGLLFTACDPGLDDGYDNNDGYISNENNGSNDNNGNNDSNNSNNSNNNNGSTGSNDSADNNDSSNDSSSDNNNSNEAETSDPNNPLSKYKCASNEILYLTKSCLPTELGTYDDWGANLKSNTYGEDGVGKLRFDAEITAIPSSAFSGKDLLTYIKLPDSIISIGNYAFSGCSSLAAFYGRLASEDNRCLIVDGVLSSFAPAGLIEYTIPAIVTSIGNAALCGCSSLTSVTIPNSVTSIGDSAFRGCSSLTSVTIGDNVTTIGELAFRECSSLTSITIPDSVTEIGGEAFSICKSLTSVTIPDGVTLIGYRAFSSNENLTSVYCKPTTPPTADHDMFPNYSSKLKIYVPRNSVDAYKSAPYWRDYDRYIEGYDF